MKLIDIHTHLLPLVKGSAIVNCSPASFIPQFGMWYSVGFHPWFIGNDISSMNWADFEVSVTHPQVLAVGEAGLDKLAEAPLALQIEVFKRQAIWADRLHKPLIIHLVKAVDSLLKLKQELRPKVPWIIHGFRGKEQQADMLVRHGFYLSLGEHFQEKVLASIPMDRLFLETDERNISIEMLYERVALLRGCSSEEVYECIGKNICAVFFKH